MQKLKERFISWKKKPGRWQKIREETLIGIALAVVMVLILLIIWAFISNKSSSLMISLAAAAIAAGTFFLRFVVDVIQRPVLSVEYYHHPPDSHKVTVYAGNSSFSAFYFALRIWNYGSLKAEQVRVKIIKIRKENFTTKTWEDIPQLTPDRLRWRLSDTRDYEPTIHPGTYEHCNIGYIFNPKSRKYFPEENIPEFEKDTNYSPDTPIYHIQVGYPSSNRPHLLLPGSYILELEASCSNGEKIEKAYNLTMTGWNKEENEAEMLRSNINIEEIDLKKMLGGIRKHLIYFQCIATAHFYEHLLDILSNNRF